jgi:hypothetical protein
MGMPFNGPLSATSVNSPNDFSNPFFTGAPSADGMHSTHFNSNFNNGFLAVDPSAMLGTIHTPNPQSHTPLSMTSHGDPVIADHSPPLNGIGRSQSADIFAQSVDNSQLTDDGLYLSETFNKHMALPFRGPVSDEPFSATISDGMFTFQTPPSTDSEPQTQLNMSGHGPMSFQTPGQDVSGFDSPSQHHQDSAIAFSASSNGSHDPAAMFNSPKDASFFSKDAKMFASPGGFTDEHNLYHQSPINNGAMSSSFDLHGQTMYGFVDPSNLGHPQQQS